MSALFTSGYSKLPQAYNLTLGSGNMIGALFWLVVLIFYLYWDFHYSRASKLLKRLKDKEPEIYSQLHGKQLPPSSAIGGVIGQGLYLKIQDSELKEEIVSISDKNFRSSLWPWFVFIGYIFLNLILSTIH